MDQSLESVFSFAVPKNELSEDGALIMNIAAQVLGAAHMESKGFSFVRVRDVKVEGAASSMVAFVSKPDPQFPARSTRHYLSVGQDLACVIRTMCLRLWADSGVFPAVDNEGQELFFPREAKSEIPYGAESLWSNGQKTNRGPKTSAPKWYSDAYDSLRPNRLSCFEASYSYAILFTILHELGHIKCHHFEEDGIGLSKREEELEADFSALVAMFSAHALTGTERKVGSALVIQMTVGVIATFVVFHLQYLRGTPDKAGRERLRGYPTVSERVSQLIRLMPLRCEVVPEHWFDDLLVVMQATLEISALHPSFGFVLGTGWIERGYSSLPVSFGKLLSRADLGKRL